jgi:hypothetical protein
LTLVAREEGKLTGLIEYHLEVFFPLFFAAAWLAATTVMALLSGWFRLMAVYPDQAIAPILRLRGQSGKMGRGTRMKGILNLSVCPTGLRVGMMRYFGPFCRDFFVPWEDITITRKANRFWSVAEFQFGNHPLIPVGTLTIRAHVADRLARAAMERWPEAGPFPEDKRGDRPRRLLAQWAAATSFVALIWMIPLVLTPSAGNPPIWFLILLPATFFGVAFVVMFLSGKG